MQCANCRFENMPGVEACGRCGASLRLATGTLDVHRPRAGKWSKRVRRVPGHAVPRRLKNAASTGWASLRSGALAEAPARPVVWRMIVPGWPQLFLRRRLLGHALLWTWLAGLLLGGLF